MELYAGLLCLAFVETQDMFYFGNAQAWIQLSQRQSGDAASLAAIFLLYGRLQNSLFGVADCLGRGIERAAGSFLGCSGRSWHICGALRVHDAIGGRNARQ